MGHGGGGPDNDNKKQDGTEGPAGVAGGRREAAAHQTTVGMTAAFSEGKNQRCRRQSCRVWGDGARTGRGDSQKRGVYPWDPPKRLLENESAACRGTVWRTHPRGWKEPGRFGRGDYDPARGGHKVQRDATAAAENAIATPWRCGEAVYGARRVHTGRRRTAGDAGASPKELRCMVPGTLYAL